MKTFRLPHQKRLAWTIFIVAMLALLVILLRWSPACYLATSQDPRVMHLATPLGPHSDSLLLILDTGQGNSQLLSVDLKTGETTEIGGNASSGLELSPSHRYLTFHMGSWPSTAGGVVDLQVKRADYGFLDWNYEGGQIDGWSPDEHFLFFHGINHYGYNLGKVFDTVKWQSDVAGGWCSSYPMCSTHIVGTSRSVDRFLTADGTLVFLAKLDAPVDLFPDCGATSEDRKLLAAAWSPDESALAYVAGLYCGSGSHDSDRFLYLARGDGTGARRIAQVDGEGSPVWRSNGTELTLLTAKSYYSYDVNQKSLKIEAASASPKFTSTSQPGPGLGSGTPLTYSRYRWSPDLTEFALGGQGDIQVFNASCQLSHEIPVKGDVVGVLWYGSR